jgi:hypothetical protein
MKGIIFLSLTKVQYHNWRFSSQVNLKFKLSQNHLRPPTDEGYYNRYPPEFTPISYFAQRDILKIHKKSQELGDILMQEQV